MTKPIARSDPTTGHTKTGGMPEDTVVKDAAFLKSKPAWWRLYLTPDMLTLNTFEY